jgi:ATP-dependent DNA helicase MPH1
MKARFDEKDLKDLTGARARLVNPEVVVDISEIELPEIPVTKPATKAKKPRGRPAAKKQTPARQRNNYGSDAMEGEESSPEPTPANMRIGTQGIDLGSHDTSGEEDDEEPDSELDAFVARSDDPIEMFSSSLPNTQQFGAKPTKKGGRLKAHKQAPIFEESDESGEDHVNGVNDGEDDETPKASRTIVNIDDDDEEDTDDASVPAAGRTKKRRVIRDSDSDE